MQQSGALAAAALGTTSLESQRYKMGLQLFTLRAAMAQDVAGTLKRIAAMGYEEVETYGFNDVAIKYTDWRPRRSDRCWRPTSSPHPAATTT